VQLTTCPNRRSGDTEEASCSVGLRASGLERMRQTLWAMAPEHTHPESEVDAHGRTHARSRERRADGHFDWDERYLEADQMWSGEPNASLVSVARRLEPGTALDVGCGEGADAIWLAGLGWRVTAIDVSEVALRRAREAAARIGVEVEWLHAGLLDATLPAAGFDLVSAQYPALSRTATHDAECSLLSAVAPHGNLLVVHHADVDVEVARSHGFDPDDYMLPANIASMLDDDWQVVVDGRRPRHVVAGAGAGHTHDIILHAQRVR
jgi:SAM-dependent methyltransferase